jgi:ribose 5-phosphate isomerase
MDADSKKKAAALAALDYVEDGTTIGVGTGSTVNHFIAALKDRRNRIAGAVSSSEASTACCRKRASKSVRSTTPATSRSTWTGPTRRPGTLLSSKAAAAH